MKRNNLMKIIGGLFLFILACVAVYRWSDDSLSCSSSRFTKITTGMSVSYVESILGQPSHVITKSDLSESRFGQGSLEGQIQRGLIYDLFDGQGIEIYISPDNIVVGKNCGYG